MKNIKKQIGTLIKLSRARGWSPLFTHYYRQDSHGNKVLGATTCVLLNEHSVPVSRGISVVSKKDNGAKDYGRLLSFQRAFRAIAGIKTPVPETVSVRGIMGLSGSVLKSTLTYDADGYQLTGIERDRIQNRVNRQKEKQSNTKTMFA